MPSTFGWVHPYSHSNLVGEWPTWKLTLTLAKFLLSTFKKNKNKNKRERENQHDIMSPHKEGLACGIGGFV